MWYKASAPGSLMLMGEHAVLQNKQALVYAVNKRMTVSLKPRNDQMIELHSPRLGFLQTTVSELKQTAPFHFVTAALCRHRDKLVSGFDLEITADFSDKMGLGSSAAVTVATLAVILAWAGMRFTSQEMIREARAIVREVQGLGSGADVAASIMGGIVSYHPEPLRIEKVDIDLPLTVIYSGYKTPTVAVVKKVREQFAGKPLQLNMLYENIEACAQEAWSALAAEDWQRFGEAMDTQQIFMQALGVSTPDLEALLGSLREHPKIHGAKISGSGLGDCVIGLGRMDDSEWGALGVLPVGLDSEGVIVHGYEQKDSC